MNEKALATYRTYGGDAAVEQFLASFAPSNPELAELTVDHVYGVMMSNPILDLKAKAAIITVAMAAQRLAPSALAFHKNAFQHQGGAPAAAEQLEAIGGIIAADTTTSIESVTEILDTETALLALLAGYATRGASGAGHLPPVFDALHKHGVDGDKIAYTLCLTSAYAGFPTAITAANAYQDWQKANLVAA